jgi:lysophospholipase L1-like esterase
MSTLCIFGDSIAYGAVDEEGGGWAQRLRMLRDTSLTDAETYVLGVCGDTSTNLLRRFASEATTRSPEQIIIAIGINDTKYVSSPEDPIVSLSQCTENILTLLDTANSIGASVTIIGLTMVDESLTQPTPDEDHHYFANIVIQKYNSALAAIATERETPFIDVFSTLTNADLYDGLHPNSEGHRKLFEKITKELLGN